MKPMNVISWVGLALALGSACSENEGSDASAGAAGESGAAGASEVIGAAGTDGGSPSSSGGGGEDRQLAGAGGQASGGTDGAAGNESAAGAAGEAQSEAPPSCVGSFGAACGPHHDDDCCAVRDVPGGTFLREYDGVIAKDDRWPATVSAFGLDKYEVTVARFRKFVEAWVAGYRPATGSGKHRHLPGGKLFNEPGWDSEWSALLPVSKEEWDEKLACQQYYGLASWTSEPAAHETKPINCLSWHEAHAFCIYDGGFLPTQAESNYAAAGGDEQRLYPWSSPPSATMASPSQAVYGCRADGSTGDPSDPCTLDDLPTVGSRSPKGDGRWGQSDLGGSVREWVLDVRNGQLPASSCVDCANFLDASGWRDGRGGSFQSSAVNLQVAKPSFGAADYRTHEGGVRCARIPSSEGSP